MIVEETKRRKKNVMRNESKTHKWLAFNFVWKLLREIHKRDEKYINIKKNNKKIWT